VLGRCFFVSVRTFDCLVAGVWAVTRRKGGKGGETCLDLYTILPSPYCMVYGIHGKGGAGGRILRNDRAMV